ncbi:MAG: rod shape-determining protein MreD [Anaerolineae bacterium]
MFRRSGWTVYLTLVSLAAIVLAQATLVSRIRVFGVSPDLLLVTVVGWGLLRGVSEGLLWGFGGGLGVDVISGLPLGTSALALLPAAWLGGRGRHTVYSFSMLLPLLLAVLASFLRGWVLLVLQSAGGVRVDWIATTLYVIGPEAVLNALLIVVVYPFMRWWTIRSDTPVTGF